mmetsp:Transcript_21828/g.35978  ORF Transcript_21828/g.35978 Transcript_21828/m.35978 type:complete len:395 (+) Transcript_21828:96-1280(+)
MSMVGINNDDDDYLESEGSNHDQEVNCEEGGPNRKRNHDGSVKDYKFSLRECGFPDMLVEDGTVTTETMPSTRRGGQTMNKYLVTYTKGVDLNDMCCMWIPPRNSVDWRGNRVTEKEGMALKHLFDDRQDYFGQHDGQPKVSLNVGRLRQEADGEADDSVTGNGSPLKDNGAMTMTGSTIWRGNLEFTYKMNYRNRDTSQKLHYMAMDVCLDLMPKKELKLGGHDMSEYCRTWMYAYAPRYTVETFLRYFEEGTGLKASTNGLVLDEEQKIVHFEPKLLTDPQSEPGFWIADEDDSEQFKRLGSVHEASKDPSNQFLFRCIGIFAVTAEVARSSRRTHGASAINEKEEARLKFTLINVRTEGIVNNIAPVIYNPRHCTKITSSNDPEWWGYKQN